MAYQPSPAILDRMIEAARDYPWEFVGVAPDFCGSIFRVGCCPRVVTGVDDPKRTLVTLSKNRHMGYWSLRTKQPAVFFYGQCARCKRIWWSAWDDCIRDWEEEGKLTC